MELIAWALVVAFAAIIIFAATAAVYIGVVAVYCLVSAAADAAVEAEEETK